MKRVTIAVWAVAGLFIFGSVIGGSSYSQWRQAQQSKLDHCIASVMKDVMTNEPEYPEDIVAKAQQKCGVKVVVQWEKNHTELSVKVLSPAPQFG